jgi:phage-related protein
MTTPYQVEFYKDSNGGSPVEKFLGSLTDSKLKAKATRALDLLEEYGPQLREPVSKPIKNGIFELRIKQSTNAVRCFYFFFQGHRAIVTNGFIKKTQKTPTREIWKASKRKKEWERRQL